MAIFKELIYHKTQSTFHQFADRSTLWGLRFSTEDDAERFSKCVNEMIGKYKEIFMSNKRVCVLFCKCVLLYVYVCVRECVLSTLWDFENPLAVRTFLDYECA